MEHNEQQYHLAWDAWIVARKNYQRALNGLADIQGRGGEARPGERGFEWHFNYAYTLYEPVAQRYLNALKVYARQRPELAGRLMYDYLQEASLAQNVGRRDVSNQHIRSVERMAVESAKIAHADWVKNGNKQTMAGVFTALADANMLNVSTDPEMKKIAREVFHLFEQGKFRREPTPNPPPSAKKPMGMPTQPDTPRNTLTPKLPPTKRPRPGGPLWIEKTIELP